MRHLYQQILVTIVGVAALCLIVSAALVHLLDPRAHVSPLVYDTARYLAADLPEPPRALKRELRRRSRRARAALALYDENGALLAQAGARLPRPEPGRVAPYWFSKRRHAGVVMALPDGRTLVMARRHARPHPGFGRLAGFLLLALVVVGLGSYWAARRITRRLEILGQGVKRLGTGAAQVRVDVEGQDEVADLAREFNAASDRIVGLLTQQGRVLAGASHELRSPLARLRMALELLRDAGGPAGAPGSLWDECERDIGELDALVDDILLGARLGDAQAERRFSSVELGALVRAEAARVGAQAEAATCLLRGDERALRSLVRNLLENATRHGAPPVRTVLSEHTDHVVLRVEDAGKPIAEADRAQLFEPFFHRTGHAEGQGGVGLGLALVRDIARHHGGDVSYAETAAGGSVFVVQLPRS